MIAVAHDAIQVWKYWYTIRNRKYTPPVCDKKTMHRFGIDKLQLEVLLAAARLKNKQDSQRKHKRRIAERNKSEQRKKTGPPIVTRDQLIADLDELHDLPRPIRVARVAAYYGISTTAVNQRVGWNAELSGKSTGNVYEPTAEQIAADAAKIRACWSATERAARARWAKSAGVELVEVGPVGCSGGVAD